MPFKLCIARQTAFDVEYLSWLAQNVFQLSIWAQYVIASESNAHPFQNDKLVDFADWQTAAVNLARKYDPLLKA